MKARVPRPGWSKDVTVKTATQQEVSSPTARTAFVLFRPKSRGRRLGHFFEFGTVQRFTRKGGSRGRFAARPFMRPALQAAESAALRAMSERLRAELARATAKLNGVRVK